MHRPLVLAENRMNLMSKLVPKGGRGLVPVEQSNWSFGSHALLSAGLSLQVDQKFAEVIHTRSSDARLKKYR
jgi:hypothetical protein